MTAVNLFLLAALALGLGLLVDELRVRVLDRRRRARQAEFHRHLDEAIEVVMGRHPSRVVGPEDDDEVMARIAEQARRTGGAR